MKVDLAFMGFEDVLKRLDMRKAQLVKAVVVSLNRTAYDVRDALKSEMPIAFDRPTPYTLGSLRVDPATSGRLFATIIPADQMAAGKGTPAKNYLGPEIFGGERHNKRTENALKAFGVLPPDMYIVPGKAASIDAYGNQSVGELGQIRSYFGSAETHAGYTANMTDKTRARLGKYKKKKGVFGYSYFVIKTHQGNLDPGIYRHYNVPGSVSVIRPILMFVRKPTYSKRYRWHEVARTVATQMFEQYLINELAYVK